MPAVYFFLIDVSMNAVHTGATAAACSAISQALSDLPVSLDVFFCMHWLLQNNMLSAFSWILLIWHNMKLIFTIYCKCIACLSYLCLETSLSCNCHPSRTFFAVKQVWWLTFWITHLLMIMLDPGYQNRGLLDSWYEFMIHGSPFFNVMCVRSISLWLVNWELGLFIVLPIKKEGTCKEKKTTLHRAWSVIIQP